MKKKPPAKARPFPPVLDLRGVKLKIDFATIHDMPKKPTDRERVETECAARRRP